jgi:hypothetical protein
MFFFIIIEEIFFFFFAEIEGKRVLFETDEVFTKDPLYKGGNPQYEVKYDFIFDIGTFI